VQFRNFISQGYQVVLVSFTRHVPSAVRESVYPFKVERVSRGATVALVFHGVTHAWAVFVVTFAPVDETVPIADTSQHPLVTYTLGMRW
jgi:hypothetical protein